MCEYNHAWVLSTVREWTYWRQYRLSRELCVHELLELQYTVHVTYLVISSACVPTTTACCSIYSNVNSGLMPILEQPLVLI